MNSVGVQHTAEERLCSRSGRNELFHHLHVKSFWRHMQNCKPGSHLLLTVIAVLALISAASIAAAQNNDRPWMNPSLSPEERADLVLRQLTLDEKLVLLHGNGMAHAPQWQMPLSNLTNGGAGYVEGVGRLGIPPLVISDAGYGVRDSGANGRYSTAMPSSLGATASWDPDSACEFGTVIGKELRAQGFNMTLGGGVDLTANPVMGATLSMQAKIRSSPVLSSVA